MTNYIVVCLKNFNTIINCCFFFLLYFCFSPVKEWVDIEEDYALLYIICMFCTGNQASESESGPNQETLSFSGFVLGSSLCVYDEWDMLSVLWSTCILHFYTKEIFGSTYRWHLLFFNWTFLKFTCTYIVDSPLRFFWKMTIITTEAY